MTAGVCAAANKLKTLVVTKELSAFKDSGSGLFSDSELRQQFRKTLKDDRKHLELKDGTEVINLEKNVVSFSIETHTGEVIYGKSVIIATGKNDLVFDLLTYKAGTGRIKVNARMQTNVPGVFAAGEANDAGENKDILVCAGEGAKAAAEAREYLTLQNTN